MASCILGCYGKAKYHIRPTFILCQKAFFEVTKKWRWMISGVWKISQRRWMWVLCCSSMGKNILRHLLMVRYTHSHIYTHTTHLDILTRYGLIHKEFRASQPYRTEFLLSSYSPSRFLPIHIRSILCVFSTGEPCKDRLILTAIPCRENPNSEHFF